ncbi:MAG: SnoaL-like domain-containing protein [Saprospiraceae bacterium]|nr:SnoaL-like domain-containing protein [Saprospiraceae bacterium]
MIDLEKKALSTFYQLWDTWNHPTDNSIKESYSTWATDGKGIGSSALEIWRGQDDFKSFCKEMFKQNPGGMKLDTTWIEAYKINEHLVALWGEFKITIELPVKNIVIDPFRITALLQLIGDEMKFIQFHSSEPDKGSGQWWPGTEEPKTYEAVSILFTDFVGFTNIVSTINPNKLVAELNEVFAAFDSLSNSNEMMKVKTIGDSYMAASGINNPNEHAVRAVKTAKEMIEFLEERNKYNRIKWDMRIGIHSGPAVGGIIGSQNLSFDLWGDTVNMASRMESAGMPNKINISRDTFELIKQKYSCTHRGVIEIKGKKKVDMYMVD